MTCKERRVIYNRVFFGFAIASVTIGVAFLLWILAIVCYKGFGALSLEVFTNSAAPAGYEGGGLKNALIGHLLLVGAASLAGIPIGLIAGTFISEYAAPRSARFIRAAAELMTSVPSILIGAFIYAVLVAPMGHFSGWAGSVALAIIMIPIVTSVTDSMLRLVSPMQREAALALGARKYQSVTQIIWRGARAGLVTGALLAIARISGETAPLLFTAFNNNFVSADMNAPMASLSVTMFSYATSPYEDWINLGWAAAFILLAFVFAINLTGKMGAKCRA
ncbi:MAG: phosphate ABC transporter permease PstA [Helicobacteraceae bacterium]|jgi:phosphate transport system permease protein|nr:phosphate ABC transporter permease PstA [Helicobacteraceae bacterium]